MAERGFRKAADEEQAGGVASGVGPERLDVVAGAQIAAIERDDVEHAIDGDRRQMLHDVDLVEVEGLAEEDGDGIAGRHVGAQPHMLMLVDTVEFGDRPRADDVQFGRALGRLRWENIMAYV